jgi:ABC-type Fe3+/spermidine/putrescine transport system ATPase subunit
MGKLEIDDVTMRFGDVVAVDRVSLTVAEGETVVLLGPSGCGKTTLLRLIAGFNRPIAGAIRIIGRTVASPTVMVPPEKRSLSMVFQSYAVWPHKTVFENLAFPAASSSASRLHAPLCSSLRSCCSTSP